VEFVSSEKVDKDGMKGRKAIYSFKDVTKLQLDTKPEKGASKDPQNQMQFKFEKLASGNSQVTVVLPREKSKEKEGSETTAPGEAKKAEKEPTEEELAEMRKMFKGLRFGVSIQVDGTIVKSNAVHVEGAKATLFELDFGAVVENVDKLKELNRKEPETLEEMNEILKGIPGIKIPLTPEVSVEFAGK
jgi:hypothetical protein